MKCCWKVKIILSFGGRNNFFIVSMTPLLTILHDLVRLMGSELLVVNQEKDLGSGGTTHWKLLTQHMTAVKNILCSGKLGKGSRIRLPTLWYLYSVFPKLCVGKPLCEFFLIKKWYINAFGCWLVDWLIVTILSPVENETKPHLCRLMGSQLCFGPLWWIGGEECNTSRTVLIWWIQLGRSLLSPQITRKEKLNRLCVFTHE